MDARDRIVLGAILAAAIAVVVFSALSYLHLRNGVLSVMEVAPVETVKVSEITAVVQVAAPRDAELYGYCSESGSGFSISITAVTGGVEQTVAEGKYARRAAESIAEYAAAYFGYDDLDFGDSSADCSHLSGWR